MNKLMTVFVVTVLSVGISAAEAAPLYECGGNPACQAKRDRMADQRTHVSKVAATYRAKRRAPPLVIANAMTREPRATFYFNAVASACSFATRLVPSA